MMPDSKIKEENEREEFIQSHTVGIEEAVIPSAYDYEDIAGMPDEDVVIPMMPDEIDVEQQPSRSIEKPSTNEEGDTDFSSMLDDIL